MEANLYFDGGVRQGVMAYGYLLVKPNDEKYIIATGNKTCGFGSSNIAEYRALIAGLKRALSEKIDVIHIMGDSQLVIKQVTKVFKVNKLELKKHCDYILELLNKFDYYTIKWIPRKQNKRADKLVDDVFKKRQH